MQPLPVVGHYHIVRELGRGGMGVVYEGIDPQIGNRRVAIKLILAARGESTQDLLRFGREAELLGRINHPNVIRVHELGRCAQGPFLVTEFVDGEELIHQLRRGPFEPRRAAEVCRLLADALGALHAEGIVHRDLKPHNVLVRPDGAPVLLDFGLARDVAAERLTQSGVVVGTPAYMPPEQAEGASDSLDPRSDVYGLGAILFHLLAGVPPFKGGSTAAMLKKILLDEPEWPDLEDEDAPLLSILRQAMAKELEARYPQIAELRDDLARFLAGEQVLAAPPKRARRRLWLAPSLGGLVLLLSLSFLFGGSNPTPQRPEGAASVESRTPVTTTETTTDPRRPASKPTLLLLHELDLPEDPRASNDFRHARFLGDELVVGFSQLDPSMFLWRLEGAAPQRVAIPVPEGWARLPNSYANLLAVRPRGDGWRVVRGNNEDHRLLVIDLDAQGSRRSARLVDPSLPGTGRTKLTSLGLSPDGRFAYLGIATAFLAERRIVQGLLVRRDLESEAPSLTAECDKTSMINELAVIEDGDSVVTLPGVAEDSDTSQLNVMFVRRWNAEDLLERDGGPFPYNAAVEEMFCLAESRGGLLAVGTRLHGIILFRPGEAKPGWLSGIDARGYASSTSSYTRAETPAAHSAIVRKLAFSPDGSLLYSVSGAYDAQRKDWEGDLRVWDMTQRKQIKLDQPLLAEFNGLDLAPKGDRLLLCDGDGRRFRIRLFELPPALQGIKGRRGD